MKSFIAILCSGLALVGTATARPAVILSGKGYYDKERLVLNVFADSAVQLRSFGILLTYNPNDVKPPEVVANSALWFLSVQPGQRAAYSPFQETKNGVRVVGARFQGDDRRHGVVGPDLLLATLTFSRVSEVLPSFQVDLAGPKLYASFVAVDGSNLDRSVDGLGTLALTMEELALDSDGDGIPDPVELAWFGNLKQANATSDSDGDGSIDLDEWIGGTSAADPKSVTHLVLVVQPDGTRRITWSGQNGRVYDILRSTDLGPFVPIAEGITGMSSTLIDPAPFPRGFYRLRTQLPAGH
jgi:hypothetical protein